MPIVITNQEFINKSNKIHNFKYDYSKSNYINTLSKISIICKIHGEFFQAPAVHLRGQDCPKCSSNKKKTCNIQKFIDKSNFLHNFKYDYSKTEYHFLKEKVIITCPIHGDFEQTPGNHLQGRSCPTCGSEKFSKSKTLKQQDVIDRMNIIHDFRYDYSKVNYIGIFDKITIICPIHGEFLQDPNNHLHGKGCKKCNHKTVYTKTSWTNVCNSKSEIPLVYVIRCFNDNEQFIKIGKTSRSIKQRFCGKNSMPYSYEIIKIIQGSPDFIWDKEIELQSFYKNYSYTPLIWFGGQTECFNIFILNNL